MPSVAASGGEVAATGHPLTESDRPDRGSLARTVSKDEALAAAKEMVIVDLADLATTTRAGAMMGLNQDGPRLRDRRPSSATCSGFGSHPPR
jgi:hypothetical protein